MGTRQELKDEFQHRLAVVTSHVSFSLPFPSAVVGELVFGCLAYNLLVFPFLTLGLHSLSLHRVLQSYFHLFLFHSMVVSAG